MMSVSTNILDVIKFLFIDYIQLFSIALKNSKKPM